MMCPECNDGRTMMVWKRDQYMTPTDLVCPTCENHVTDPAVIAEIPANRVALIPDWIEKPTFNLNGSDPQEMLEGYAKALEAVRAVRMELGKIMPHSRDYQLSHPTGRSTHQRYNAARTQHEERISALHGIMVDLEHLAEYAVEYIDWKESRK